MKSCVMWILVAWLGGLCCVHAVEQVPIEDDHDVYQKEVEISMPILQREVYMPIPGQRESIFSPRGRRPFSGFPNNNLNDFPPGKPSSENIGNICRKNRPVVSYGSHNIPQTGFSHLGRQGHCINSLEEGYTRCCQQSDRISCAENVWKEVMETFCEQEFSVKTRHYHCCKKSDLERDTCFSDEAPNPNYIYSSALQEISSADAPSLGRARSFQPCPRNSPTCQDTPDNKYKLSDLTFPPGEPKSSNIQNICKLRKYRPLYTDSTLPHTSHGHFTRRAKAIYRIESEFKKCCKKEDVACAHSGWQKVLTDFCDKELMLKTKPYECCKKTDQAAMFSCFASEAPFPEYDKEVEKLNLSNITEDILDKLCGESKLLTKQKQMPLLVSGLKDSCCSLPHDKKLICAQEQREKFMKTLCGSKKDSWKDTQDCCSKEDLEREECFTNYLQGISMAISQRIKVE